MAYGIDDRLLAVLLAHNPWLEEPGRQAAEFARGLPENFIQRLKNLPLQPGVAELVIGPRQAGKSTWIRSCLTQQSDPVLVLHAEEPRIQELCRSPAEALRALQGVLTPRTILFFEEVQHLHDAPLFIKGLVDLEKSRRIVATGSASLQLKGHTRESLAGRARRTALLPFSLSEVMASMSEELLPAIRDAKALETWERLAVIGGYPRPWLDENPQTVLYRLVEAFAIKDASDLNNIARPDAFRKLLELAAADTGNLANMAAWASVASVARETAVRYLSIAEEAHLLRLVPPFASGKRAELTQASKIFFIDCGLRNAIFGGFEPVSNRVDKGALWENAVFGELIKHADLLDRVYHWRSKNGAEVDFVVKRGSEIVGIEVKAEKLKRPALSRSTRSFIEAVKPSRFFLINAALRYDEKVASVPVLWRRPWELAEALS